MSEEPRKPRKRQSGRPSEGRRGRSDQRPKPTDRGRPGKPRRVVAGPGTTLPKWLREEITRVTRKERLPDTLDVLERATDAFAAGRYGKARALLLEAKQLSPRASAIRELLGLSAYRSALWKEALTELRTYRRLTGDTIHMAVEMDALRAMGKADDVHKVWQELRERGGRPEALKEGRVVYASFLIDEGDVRGAWEVANPHTLNKQPFEEDLRQWYVAAKAAALLGDGETARKLLKAIEKQDPSLPGLDELRSLIGPRSR